MNIECPQCGSTEFTKLSLIYAEGFSDLEARSRGGGLMPGGGGVDFGFGKFCTKGEIQTKLSQQVSPPHKWSYWKILFGGLIGRLILEFMLGYVDTFLRVGGNFNQQLTWFGQPRAGLTLLYACLVFRLRPQLAYLSRATKFEALYHRRVRGDREEALDSWLRRCATERAQSSSREIVFA